MKERYKQVIWRMYDDMRQIPLAISGLGAASAFAGSYINAYKDIEPAWQYMNIILDGLKNIDTYENIIKTNKDCDNLADTDYHINKFEKILDIISSIKGTL